MNFELFGKWSNTLRNKGQVTLIIEVQLQILPIFSKILNMAKIIQFKMKTVDYFIK